MVQASAMAVAEGTDASRSHSRDRAPREPRGKDDRPREARPREERPRPDREPRMSREPRDRSRDHAPPPAPRASPIRPPPDRAPRSRDAAPAKAGDPKDAAARDAERRKAAHRRTLSPAAPRTIDYGCKVPAYTLNQSERQYVDVQRRYPNATLPLDFVKLVCSWMQEPPDGAKSLGCSLLQLDQPVSFEHEVEFQPQPPLEPPSRPKGGGVHYKAKVLLTNGLDEAAVRALRDGAGRHGGDHLHKLLKFVTLRTEKGAARSGIQAPGGPVDPAVDGAPSVGDGALIAALVRQTREQLGLDLGACRRWRRLVEVHYARPASPASNDLQREVTVYFVTDAASALPSEADWPAVWAAQQEFRAAKKAHDAAGKEKGHKEVDEKGSDDRTSKDDRTSRDAEPAAAKDAKATSNGTGAAAGNAAAAADGADKGDGAAAAGEPATAADAATGQLKQDPTNGTVPMDTDASNDKDADERKMDVKKEAPKMPAKPTLLLRGRREPDKVWRSQAISLDGLLDYEEEDREEATVELSLAAEALQEALATDYGGAICDHLLAEREKAEQRRDERRRKRDAEEAAAKAAKEDGRKEKDVNTSDAKEEKDVANEAKAGSKRSADDDPGNDGASAKRVKTEEPAAVEGADAKMEDAAHDGDAAPKADAAAAVEQEDLAAESADGAAGVVTVEGEEAAPAGRKGPAARRKAPAKKAAAKKPPARTTRATRGKAKQEAEAAAAGEAAPDANAEQPAAEVAEAEAADEKPEPAAEAAGTDVPAAEPAAPADAQPTEGGVVVAASAADAAPNGAINSAAADAKEDAQVEATKDDKGADRAAADGRKGAEKEKERHQEREKEREKETEKSKRHFKTDDDLLVACRYFDRTGANYIRVDDLRRLLHVLGRGLPHWLVREAAGVLATAEKGRQHARPDRVSFRDIYEREEAAASGSRSSGHRSGSRGTGAEGSQAPETPVKGAANAADQPADAATDMLM